VLDTLQVAKFRKKVGLGLIDLLSVFGVLLGGIGPRQGRWRRSWAYGRKGNQQDPDAPPQ
jgi:hypothetical protein